MLSRKFGYTFLISNTNEHLKEQRKEQTNGHMKKKRLRKQIKLMDPFQLSTKGALF